MNTHTARQLLAELELISHGTTQAWDASGGHSSEKPAIPPGESNPPHLWLRAELNKALTQTQVDKVAQKARECLRKARYSPPSPSRVIYGTAEWRKVIAADSRSADVVADHYGISAGHVHRLRRLHKQEATA